MSSSSLFHSSVGKLKILDSRGVNLLVSTTVSGVIFKGTACRLDLGTLAYVDDLSRAFKAYISTSSPPTDSAEVFLLLVVSSSMILVLLAIVGELSSQD